MSHLRLAKVNSLLQEVISSRLAEVFTPAEALATITSVEVSPDLRKAMVWVSLLPTEAVPWADLQAILPELQEAVANHTEMKFTPKLQLRQDRGTIHARHIEDLLQEL